MSTVRSALIQTYGSMSMEENVERQIALIEQAAEAGRADYLPAGTSHRPLLLPGAGPEILLASPSQFPTVRPSSA